MKQVCPSFLLSGRNVRWLHRIASMYKNLCDKTK